MSGSTRVLDRIVGVLVGLVLVAAGLAAIGWHQRLVLAWPDRIDLTRALDAVAIDWVPVVMLLGGLLLIGLGLRWLFAHARTARVRMLPLAGSAAHGRLRADLRSVAAAAAADLADCPGVVDCRSRTVHDRRQTVVELTPALSSDVDLTEFAAAADRVSALLRMSTGTDDVHVRIRARVQRAAAAAGRVR